MSYEDIKIAITGGGTGGHIFPALAVIEYLQQKGFRNFLYIGGKKGLENQIIPDKNIPFKQIWISGFDRGNMLKNLTFPLKLVVSFFQSLLILLRYRPHIVIGFGGYVSGPVIFTAASILIPTMIMEQDVYPGVTTRIAARWAKRILLAFEEGKKYFSEIQRQRIRITGNPVRPSLKPMPPEVARQKLGLTTDAFTLLVMGGSQGAQAINEALIRHIDTFRKENIQIIWQTGHRNYEKMKAQLENIQHGTVLLKPFFDDMATVYSAADLVVNRSGALTIAELLKMQKPSVLIPYPFAAGDHQRKNAAAMQNRGVAVVVDQDDEQFDRKLVDVILKFKNDPRWMDSYMKKLSEYSENKALELIFDNMVDLIATKI